MIEKEFLEELQRHIDQKIIEFDKLASTYDLLDNIGYGSLSLGYKALSEMISDFWEESHE